MLDLEFAELSDVGVVRDHNEDYLGSCLPARSEGQPHAAGYSWWQTAWAERIAAKWLRKQRWKR